jgi:hypothetical protein
MGRRVLRLAGLLGAQALYCPLIAL